jgi:toxin CptA
MLRISLKPSRYLAALVGAAHAAAAALVLPLDLPLAAKVALGAAIVLSAWHSAWGGAMLRGSRSILSIELDRERRISVQSRAGGWQEATLLGTTYVSPALTILNVRVRGERLARHVVVLPDSMPSEDFRQLRVLLRWSRKPADAGAAAGGGQ